MPLFPSWVPRLAEVAAAKPVVPNALAVPRSPAFYAGQTSFVATVADARALAELAQQRPVAWVGFDTEFRYGRPGVVIDEQHTAYDPRSIQPLLLSLALAEPEAGGGRLYSFVIDVRRADLLPAVQAVLRLPCPFAGDKDRLQQSFLDWSDEASFSEEQIRYAAADATAAAQLYLPQVAASARSGILNHLQTVEMPWVVTNARMVWQGVKVDAQKCRVSREACERHLARLQPELAAMGIPNVRSHKQLQAFFAKEGLLESFRRDGKVTFDKNQLADFADRHPAIPLIRAARRVHDLRKEKILTGEFVGADGRVHPEYRHLGTHTGRQTSRWPNVLGLGRVFRPLIVPEPGRGIGEVDWSQIEVGIAAAVYGDRNLIEMFNTGDVYSAMAQRSS